jgi:Rrf2 family protein
MFANSHFALATHVLVALALNEGSPQTSAELARSVNTNAAFLRMLLGRLREAGLIRVTLGKGGGASLARSPSHLTLADVYRAVERQPARLHHGEPNPSCVVGRNIVPMLQDVLHDVESAAVTRLSRMTVAKLAHQVRLRG